MYDEWVKDLGEMGVAYFKLSPNCPKFTKEGIKISVKCKFSSNLYRTPSEYVSCVNITRKGGRTQKHIRP
jgi:hypothetical protein